VAYPLDVPDVRRPHLRPGRAGAAEAAPRRARPARAARARPLPSRARLGAAARAIRFLRATWSWNKFERNTRRQSAATVTPQPRTRLMAARRPAARAPRRPPRLCGRG
jgi:hypothetical protein